MARTAILTSRRDASAIWAGRPRSFPIRIHCQATITQTALSTRPITCCGARCSAKTYRSTLAPMEAAMALWMKTIMEFGVQILAGSCRCQAAQQTLQPSKWEATRLMRQRRRSVAPLAGRHMLQVTIPEHQATAAFAMPHETIVLPRLDSHFFSDRQRTNSSAVVTLIEHDGGLMAWLASQPTDSKKERYQDLGFGRVQANENVSSEPDIYSQLAQLDDWSVGRRPMKRLENSVVM